MSESFEDKIERLSAIVDDLERGDLPLEEGVALFKQGLTLARECSNQLEKAKNEVKVISQGLAEDFEHQKSGEGEEA